MSVRRSPRIKVFVASPTKFTTRRINARRCPHLARVHKPQADRAHGYLWLRLSNAGVAEVKKAGSLLNDLRRERNRADYDDHRTITQAIAAQNVQFANEVIQALDAAAVDPVRTQITDAMKVYERDVLHDVTWHP